MPHDHGRSHIDPKSGDRQVSIAIWTNSLLTVVQIVGGILAGSLAPNGVPAQFANGPNLYGYALGSPAMWTDPQGQFVPLLWVGTAALGAAVGAGTDLRIQLFLSKGNWSCVGWSDVAISAAIGVLLSGLGPEGFILGRGGAKAYQHGYPAWAPRPNRGNRRFGWSSKNRRTALHLGIDKKHYDLPGSLAGEASPLRSGIPGGLGAGAATGSQSCSCQQLSATHGNESDGRAYRADDGVDRKAHP